MCQKTNNKFYKNNSALIVVDMQNDFYVGGSLQVNGIEKIIKPIKFLLEKAISENVKIIFTMDEHPENHISFIEWPIHCVQSTKGSHIIDELNRYKKDLIVSKGNDINIENYSCFYNGKNLSNLDNFLKLNNISNLYIVGVVGEYCIKYSALDAIKFNFNVYLIREAICSISNEFNLNSINEKIKVI